MFKMANEQITEIEELQCLVGIMRRRQKRREAVSIPESSFFVECEKELMEKLIKREIRKLEEQKIRRNTEKFQCEKCGYTKALWLITEEKYYCWACGHKQPDLKKEK
jgi:uncharacterized protein YdaU (DUF1376 family)